MNPAAAPRRSFVGFPCAGARNSWATRLAALGRRVAAAGAAVALAATFLAPGPATAARAAAPPPPTTAQGVLERVRASVASIRDASVRLTIESVDDKDRRSRTVLRAALLREPAVVRLEVVEPSALADQVYVIDFESRKLQVYLPVTNQILVRALDRPAPPGSPGQTAPPLASPDQLLALLPSGSGESSARLVGTESSGGRTAYVLELPVPEELSAEPGDAARLGPAGPLPGLAGLMGAYGAVPAGRTPRLVRVWVDGSTWLATRIALYGEGGKQLAAVTLTDVRLNSGLRPDALRRLPADAEIVEG